MKYKLHVLLFCFCLLSYSQIINKKVSDNYDLEVLNKLKNETIEKENLNLVRLKNFSNKFDYPLVVQKEDGSFSILHSFTFDNYPLYYAIDNLDAARSTRTNFMHGFLGLNMHGESMTVGVWDGGTALLTHDEFTVSNSDITSRMVSGDGNNYNGNSLHATHVSGTIGARGKVNLAKGMAPQINLRSYDWNNDESEVISQATNGLLISNHSYGVPMYDGGTFQVSDWYPGSYSSDSRTWDVIAYNAPYYLMVVSAGNEGQEVNPHSFQPGYDKLNGNKTSKNNLVVANAQDANIDTFSGDLISVAINPSSSQGPTDDFRVKPDISGNGTSVYSSTDVSNSSYTNLTGTSMAAPNVAGSIILLQQYYNSIFSQYMKAATLKGLVCHTADDAGSVGPDPSFGWGLLNMKEASDFILAKANNSVVIEEKTLINSQSFTLNFSVDVTSDIKASISWTDVPGVINEGQINNATPALVNDLDLRIFKEGVEEFFPWKINPLNVTQALKEDNNVDNIEIVSVSNATSGNYQLVVTHKGNLSSGSQDYSLILSGNNVVLGVNDFELVNLTEIYPNPVENMLNINSEIELNRFEIFDFQGRIIKTGRLNYATNSTIDLIEINSGFYFVKLYSDINSVTKKFYKK